MKPRPDLTCIDHAIVECLFVQISQPLLCCKDLIVGVVYRPPGANVDSFYHNLFPVIEKINSENRPCYVVGDMNIDLLNNTNKNGGQALMDGMYSNGFCPRIDRPTRVTDDTATLIDHIYSNVHNNGTMSGIWAADIADHLPIYITLRQFFESTENKTEQNKYISKRIYSPDNNNTFKNKLSRCDWSEVINADGTNDKFNLFMSVVTNLHNECFPLVRIKINQKRDSKPWINKTILNSVKKKNTLYRQYLKTKSTSLLAKYKAYKNKLQEVIRKAEKQYYSNKIEESKGNLSRTWKILKSMINKKQVERKIGPIEVNTVLIEDEETMANNFNNYFANVGPDLAKKIPTCDAKPTDYFKK